MFTNNALLLSDINIIEEGQHKNSFISVLTEIKETV
jgi:hypothetical protein